MASIASPMSSTGAARPPRPGARRRVSESEGQKQAGSTLTGVGVTLLGIILSLAVTVGFGIPGPWWLRVGAGAATAILIVGTTKLGTRHGSRGPLARIARWILNGPA